MGGPPTHRSGTHQAQARACRHHRPQGPAGRAPGHDLGGDVLAAKENAADVHIVYYEDCVLNGAEALRPAFASWGWDDLPAILHELMSQPSSTTHDWADLDSVEGKLGRWKNELDNETVDQILYVAHCMGVQDYSYNGFPDKTPR